MLSKKPCILKREMRHEHNRFKATWCVENATREKKRKRDKKSDEFFSSLLLLNGCPAPLRTRLGPLRNQGATVL